LFVPTEKKSGTKNASVQWVKFEVNCSELPVIKLANIKQFKA
jgi:hypothetical protein